MAFRVGRDGGSRMEAGSDGMDGVGLTSVAR